MHFKKPRAEIPSLVASCHLYSTTRISKRGVVLPLTILVVVVHSSIKKAAILSTFFEAVATLILGGRTAMIDDGPEGFPLASFSIFPTMADVDDVEEVP